MAVCGLLSMLCVFPIHPDMDSCPGRSLGVARKSSQFRETIPEAQASSCLSSTMVESNDPDDSGSSQPPNTSESKHSNLREQSLQRPELELSISILNDAQRNSEASLPQRLRSVKEEIDPSSTSTSRDEAIGGHGCGEDESAFTGPPRKRARMSPLGFSLEDSRTGIPEQQRQSQRHFSLSSSSDITRLHGLIPSLPTHRTDREPSPSRGSAGGSKMGTSWWLTPKSSAPVIDSQHYQSAQDAARANFGSEGRGTNLGNTLQEREHLFKKPPFFPNMLSSMESEHGRRGEDASSTAISRPSSDQGRTQLQLQEQTEHFFFSGKEPSTSRLSSASTVSEEAPSRSNLTFFHKSREGASGHETNTVFVEPQSVKRRHPSVSEPQQQGVFDREPNTVFVEPQSGKRRHLNVSEPQQQGVFDREVQQQHPHQGTFSRQQGLEQRSLLGPSLQGPSGSGNANTSFYARILNAAQQPLSTPFSQTGFPGTFNPGSLSFNIPGQPTRTNPQLGVGAVHFGGEANSSLVQQQVVNNDVMRNLAAHQSIPALAMVPFMSQMQTPDPARPSAINSVEFLQSFQRPPFPQVGDRYSRPPGSHVMGVHQPQQEFSYLNPPPPSHHSLPGELNLSFPPRGAQMGLQTSAGVREFLPIQGPLSAGQGRGPAVGSHGFSAAMELPTNLSLQGPNPVTPLPVFMEGRSIGRCILQEYDGYESFAAAMRSMFESISSSQEPRAHGASCTLANAIPGYVIAYEDDEGDVLLAGDLPWREFIRVAKQIRIISSSKISFKPTTGPSQS